MGDYKVTLSRDKEVYHFQISECPHHDGERCKYRVFEHGVFVASFEPDSQQFLHICQNTAGLNEGLLYDLADQIEAKISRADSNHFNNKTL